MDREHTSIPDFDPDQFTQEFVQGNAERPKQDFKHELDDEPEILEESEESQEHEAAEETKPPVDRKKAALEFLKMGDFWYAGKLQRDAGAPSKAIFQAEPEDLEQMAEYAAEGMSALGVEDVEMPWWLGLGITGYMSIAPRLALCREMAAQNAAKSNPEAQQRPAQQQRPAKPPPPGQGIAAEEFTSDYYNAAGDPITKEEYEKQVHEYSNPMAGAVAPVPDDWFTDETDQNDKEPPIVKPLEQSENDKRAAAGGVLCAMCETNHTKKGKKYCGVVCAGRGTSLNNKGIEPTLAAWKEFKAQ